MHIYFFLYNKKYSVIQNPNRLPKSMSVSRSSPSSFASVSQSSIRYYPGVSPESGEAEREACLSLVFACLWPLGLSSPDRRRLGVSDRLRDWRAESISSREELSVTWRVLVHPLSCICSSACPACPAHHDFLFAHHSSLHSLF